MLRRFFLVICTLLVSAVTMAQVRNNDWPMYGRNLEHTFTNPHSDITTTNVANLTPAWSFPTTDAVTASPSVVDGIVYVGSWDGFFYAFKAHPSRPGHAELVWAFQVDCQGTVAPVPPHCLPPGQTPPDRSFSDGGLITSSAAVVNGHVYFAAGKTVYSLNARDGSLHWKHVICGNPDIPNCALDDKDTTRIFVS